MTFFGCSHSRTSFPLTPKKGPRKGQTYIVCLDCGKEFTYSWAEMRISVEQPERVGQVEVLDA